MRQGLLRAGTPRDFADAKLVFLRVRFWRTALPAAGIVTLGAVQKEMGSPNYFKFTREFKSAKI